MSELERLRDVVKDQQVMLERQRVVNEELARRLSALERRAEPVALSGGRPAAGVVASPAVDGGAGVSRRGLLTAAAGVAGGVGLVVEQAVQAPAAQAASGGALVLGANNDAGGSQTSLTSTSFTTLEVFGSGVGVYSHTSTGYGVWGSSESGQGVYGLSNSGYGVEAGSESNTAVYANSNRGKGVLAVSQSATGVSGTSTSGTGVSGTSGSGVGVSGTSSSSTGVSGHSTSAPGVYGVSSSQSGVHAVSGSNVGVIAEGGLAPLRLVPATSTGKPTSGTHQLGELFVDKTGALYLCTTAGKPGSWKKVTVT